MKKQPEVTAQTRQNLIDAFWTLYRERGIEKITVKEIAIKAGYNRGTFYEYFADVYDVLEQIENSLIPSINELPPVTIPSGQFGMPLHLFLEFYESNSRYFSVLLGDKGDPAFVGKLKNTIKPMLIEALVPKDDLEKAELEFALEYILSGMIGVMSYWFKQNKPLSVEKLMELMSDLMENGAIAKFKRRS